jgi:hypothetical protein
MGKRTIFTAEGAEWETVAKRAKIAESNQSSNEEHDQTSYSVNTVRDLRLLLAFHQDNTASLRFSKNNCTYVYLYAYTI